jgi:hypothetical protein
MGIAHLLGQLGVGPAGSIERALLLLAKAADKTNIHAPQPSYVYSLLLLSQFNPYPHPIPTSLLISLNLIQWGNSLPDPLLLAKSHLEKSAFYHYLPAQYKLAHCYEFAMPCPLFGCDPLLSVQWYSLASQAGEVEADMALSKWFLCGAEGAFEKDEQLAYMFAEQAVKQGLPSVMFVMGYYSEVGIGTPGGKNLGAAREWYEKARRGGNQDAEERLVALANVRAEPGGGAQGGGGRGLSRTEHEVITESRLGRGLSRGLSSNSK